MKIWSRTLVFFLVPGCDNAALVGNGFCNDETNNANCKFDGGDCCVLNANTNSCFECGCHLLETCVTGYHPLVGNGFCDDDTNIDECEYDGGDCCSHPNMVGDGICNDETNHLGCNFDGGDCCVNVNTESCAECNCLGSGVITSPRFLGNYENLDMIWLIQVQMGQMIEIVFSSFEIDMTCSDCW